MRVKPFCQYFCLAWLACGQAAWSAEQIGVASTVVNAVAGSVDGQSRKINVQDDVFFDERVTTGPDGASEFTFKDDTTLQLGPGSELSLDAFVYDPSAQGTVQQMVMTFGPGAFRFVSGNMNKEAYVLNGPFGQLGVRGTSLFISTISSESSAVLVEEGAMLAIDKDGNETAYPAGTIVEIDRHGAAHASRNISPALAAQVAGLNATMAGAGAGIPHQISVLSGMADQSHDVYTEGCH